MTTRPLRLLVWLPATVLILNELIRTYIRPVYGRRQYGLLSTVLGWLPNLLAPLGFVAIGMVALLLLQRQGQPLARTTRWWVLLALVAASLAGFL